MKYHYKFSTGAETVDIDEAWVDVLKDFDRQESNGDRNERRHVIHYEAFGFEPEFMGREDEGLVAMFDGTPAFEYAIEHLLPRHREILYRRAFRGEKFADIGKSYDISASAVHHYYTMICARFRRYYEEGNWLYSSQNTKRPAADRINSIPFGLTPLQVMAIRSYRYEFKSMQTIAKLVGVPLNRVKQCLHLNPVLETKCPRCGTSVPQSAYGRMQVFCSRNCYDKWTRSNSVT